MFQAKCLEKIRDKRNNITGYKLVDKDKNEAVVKPNRLKEAIRAGQIEVINLTLTSDNRLMDKKPATPSNSPNTPSKQSLDVEAIINKAKGNGYSITAFDTDCGHKCYIASSPDNTKHVFIIPDDVKRIYRTDAGEFYFRGNSLYSYMSNIKGTLKVVGGKNLISARNLFKECSAQSIDFSSFDTSNVTNMRRMFRFCEAQSLDLSSFDTSNVTDMSEMFYKCKAQSLNLSSFNASSVKYMECMFYGCEASAVAPDPKIFSELCRG